MINGIYFPFLIIFIILNLKTNIETNPILLAIYYYSKTICFQSTVLAILFLIFLLIFKIFCSTFLTHGTIGHIKLLLIRRKVLLLNKNEHCDTIKFHWIWSNWFMWENHTMQRNAQIYATHRLKQKICYSA